MGYIQPKRDYKDGEILYGIDLSASNEVIKAGVDDNFDRIQGLQSTKQDVINDENKLDYSLLDNTPDIPEKTSDLTNDSGFIDNSYHDISKQDILQSGINIKTINDESILGEGNLVVEGIGTTDYDELENQPSINNVTLEGNKSLSDLGIDIPTKISDLDNDNHTVTDADYVHTDSNYTPAEKSKLAGIEAGAQANVTEVVVDDTPTADTQLVIDDYDISPSSSATEITNEYSDSTEIGFSCHYANNNFASKAGDTFTGNLIIANATYLKGIDESNNNISLIRAHIVNNQGFVAIGDSLFPTRIWASEMPTINIGGTIYTIATTDNLSSYLPLGGGTLSGNLTINKGSNDDNQLFIGNTSYAKTNQVNTRNSAKEVGMGVDSGGDFRIWDYTNSQEILRSKTGGYNTFNGSIKYQHSNEINFSGGTQSQCIFNYRNADTDNYDSSATCEYWFCNYNGRDVSKSTLIAGNVDAHLKYDVLYNNTSGTNGSFDTSYGYFDWYDHVIIYFKNNDGVFNSITVYTNYSSNNPVVLQANNNNDDYIWVKTKKYTLWSRSAESTSNGREIKIGAGTVGSAGGNNIYITRIEGYK